jgi:hypothetical protein
MIGSSKRCTSDTKQIQLQYLPNGLLTSKTIRSHFQELPLLKSLTFRKTLQHLETLLRPLLHRLAEELPQLRNR